jgi:hypothetical protein
MRIACVLLVALLATSARAQESTRKEFEEYRDTMEGRWVGEITLALDWPSIGKKGDTITGYSDIRISADGNALSRKFYAGGGTGEGVTFFDAGAKQIKAVTVTSGGTVLRAIIHKCKECDKWMTVPTGSNPNGDKVTGKGTLTVSDGGNVHTWRQEWTVAGKKISTQERVWRRVNK